MPVTSPVVHAPAKPEVVLKDLLGRLPPATHGVVRGAVAIALHDLRGYSECLAGCTCAPCIEFDRLAASFSG